MAIEVTYRKRIPYPFARVLSQYFDLEHIETVHPTTLGSYRAVEVAGNRIVFEQHWPSWLGLRLRSVVEQVWRPPNRIRIRFRRGFLRGVGVDTELVDQGETTAIEEVYRVPLVPAWAWLRPWMAGIVERGAGRIWEEDLAVELCHGGWPGVPGRGSPHPASTPSDPASPPPPPTASNDRGRWVRVAERADVEAGPTRASADGREIVLLRHAERLYALDNRCTHTDGPLALGWIEGDRVVCPWHGARFGLADGLPCDGPADRPVATYPVREEGGGVFVQVDGAGAAL